MPDLSHKMTNGDKDRHFKNFNQIKVDYPTYQCHACGCEIYGQRRTYEAIMLNRIVQLCNRCGPVVSRFNKTVKIV